MDDKKIELCLVYKNDEQYFIEKVDAIRKGLFYQVNTVPAFAKNISYGDLVKAEYENGEYHFDELIEESGHSTMHIVVFKSNEKVVARLIELGCGVNINIAANYLVVDIPPIMPYYSIKKFLDLEQSKNTLDYSESCISQRHKLNYS